MKRLVCLLLLLSTVCSAFWFSACSITDHNDDPDNIPANGEIDEITSLPLDEQDTNSAFELDPPPMDKPAIIHMIKPSELLEDWQSGKTELSASLYVDDMMKVLDSLEWENASDDIEISRDFHFRINLFRPKEELSPFLSFISDAEETTAEAETEDTTSDISVQYLINIEDKIVNMRFSDYSAQTFDVYAELDETNVRILVLCLKYYFGALK